MLLHVMREHVARKAEAVAGESLFVRKSVYKGSIPAIQAWLHLAGSGPMNQAGRGRKHLSHAEGVEPSRACFRSA